MARILSLFPASLIAARADLSANEFYRQLRAEGIAARRSEVLSLYRISRSIVARSGDEPFRDISQRPQGDQLTPWPTKQATNIRQNVTLVYRDTVTGTLNVTYWSTSHEAPITREEALARSIDAYSSHAEDYNQDLIGAIHTGAYQYVPFMA